MTETTAAPRLLAILRRSPGIRSTAYLGAMAGVIILASRAARDVDNPHPYHIHHIAFPSVVVITGLFARMRPEDWEAWQRLPCWQDLKQLVGGAE